MLTTLTWLLMTPQVAARDADLAIVSAHLDDLSDEDARQLAAQLVETVDGLSNLKATSPGELRGRISGREALIVEGIFLSPGRRSLEEGRVLYDRGEFESAIPVLGAAAEALRAGLAGAGDSKDLIDTLLLLGLASAAIGDDAAAADAFAQVVVLEPQRQLDRFNYPPKIVSSFNTVRDEALGGARGVLTVISPDDASLFVDGRPVPRVDRATEITGLLAGEHYVLVQADGGRRSFEVVDMDGDAVVRTDLETRSIAPTAETSEERSIQTEQLYRALGEYADTALLLIAGETQPGMVGVQLYEPRTGNFSRLEELPVGAQDALPALQESLRRLDAYVDDGALKVEFLQLGAAPLDINTNPLLLSLLLDPEPIVETVVQRRTPWYVWAGAGALAAGGAAGAAVLLSADIAATTGTVVVNLPD
ncbi:MAG: hypothetical protein ACI8S6_004289 [Myxococcota bacterium]|jgi:hypothetical protein